jgi:hypothetical protein
VDDRQRCNPDTDYRWIYQLSVRDRSRPVFCLAISAVLLPKVPIIQGESHFPGSPNQKTPPLSTGSFPVRNVLY